MTYHHPMKEGKLLNYGFNFNYLADKYADFFIWRSPVEVYQPSSIANMGRKGNTFYMTRSSILPIRPTIPRIRSRPVSITGETTSSTEAPAISRSTTS